jgi:hypothetical protein
VVRKLREADKLLAEGAEIATVARHLEVSEHTFHRWRNQYGGMKADDAKRLKGLERENARLKGIVGSYLRLPIPLAWLRKPGIDLLDCDTGTDRGALSDGRIHQRIP